jgi:hypothetical protein
VEWSVGDPLPFSVFSNSGHVGWMSGLPDIILKGGHQRTKQSLVPIGPVVSEMKIFLISSPFFILSNSDHVGWTNMTTVAKNRKGG